GKIAPPAPPFHLRFDGVTVRFRGEARSALHNVSFEIRPGQQVALIGETGAGKSTVAQLLLRFLEPTEGRITVSGVPLEEIDPEQWRRRLTWVPQAPYLFHTSVAENLRLANPEASDEQLWRALEQAHLAEFVAALPQGLDTSVGEGGARFSTGQAQRLALARAFLRDAPLLILDEPTSNVDPELEAQLQQSTRELLRGRTALVIAHRLNTVLDADWVVVLERGRVVQQGPPRILAEQSGPFSTLLRAYAEVEL
ncbi:MAG TPA: ATP-binding cassette domain-containing protein, partial [Bacteroidetes bacterium]|nr:ATP-binding cassette domain-containing protein [Bacteroidota bacterium]